MRDKFSSFDVARIVEELQDMIGARMRKAYQPHYEQIVLKLNRKGLPSTDLVIVRGKRMYTSQRDRPMPSKPSQFAMVIRKHLNNARLIGVKQYGFDRVIELVFERGIGEIKIVIELFRDGNVLLIDTDGIIIQPLTHANYSTRIIKKGLEYAPPPASLDPRNLSRANINQLLDESEHDLIRTLAVRANFGALYGSIACSNANLEESIISNLMTIEQRDSLEKSINHMVKELSENKFVRIWVDDINSLKKWNEISENSERDSLSSTIIEVAPINVPYLDKDMAIEIESLSLCFDILYGTHDAAAFIRREEEKLVNSGKGEGERQAKLDRRSAQQKLAIDRFLQRAAINQELGKSIQENWDHVNDILEQFNSAIKNENWQSIEAKLKDASWVGKLNPAKQTIVAYLPDEDGDPGASITLQVDKNVHQNAQRYFEDARSQKNKAVGARRALETTELSKTMESKKAAKNAAAGRLKESKRSKKFWFEKYRWSMLKNGNLIVGGNDAKGNDNIVKKHLNSNDLYFHADLHGAASCSLKLSEGFEVNSISSDNIPEGIISLKIVQNLSGEIEDARDLPKETHQEAAQMAVCWSRAWGSGNAAATVFHARPSQVSKTTESGESLGRGSFVVRGKRSWYKDISLELGIGIGVINGVPLPILGTPDTISSIFPRWAKIIPSKEKKENIANKIAKSTGLSQDDVLSCLPPGGCSMVNHGLIP
ncbi:MAG: ribosome rescue protein RqcH [Candidatus Poseidoniales archaeon]|jgi:predicted ribosome quality control (RQC) complex YloA/Tae2 family protein|tara:strand:+ start:680 stop:2818 length:2139 start_codon:yes stop_codon:yes gene_type:complete